jgi:hypothetical protein
VSRWLTGLESLEYGNTNVPVIGMSRVTTSGWQECPGDWKPAVTSAGWQNCPDDCQVNCNFNRVTPMCRWLKGLQPLQQNNAIVAVTDRSMVTSTVWHWCPVDWQFYSLFNRGTLMSRCLTCLEWLQRGDTSVLVFNRSRVNQEVDQCSRWLTGLHSLQHGETSVPMSGRSRDMSTGWHQFGCDWQE